jgi:hypothetical protein
MTTRCTFKPGLWGGRPRRNSQQGIEMEINNPAMLGEVTPLFKRYQDAMISNPVEVLNELFWHNALTVR